MTKHFNTREWKAIDKAQILAWFNDKNVSMGRSTRGDFTVTFH